MQIWLFFQAGTGGDGVANLFERSKNITPIDNVTDYWRIHRIVDNDIKFYSPTIDNFGCFRYNQRFSEENNNLRKEYIDIVNQNLDCVITSHDTTLDLLLASDCQDVLLKNQIKVLLTADCSATATKKFATKNLLPVLPKNVPTVVCPEKFDYVLDVNLVKTDWNYVKTFCNKVNLDLCKNEYLQYRDLLLGNKTYMSGNFGVEEWVSNINGTQITYNLVNTWQAQSLDR
jgi:hypothetical protein